MRIENQYTLQIQHENENIVSSQSDNLSRLTAQLFILLEYEFPNSQGHIIDNATNEIVRSARCEAAQ